MDLLLTDDQQLLRETTARFAELELPLAAVRDLAERRASVDATFIRQVADLGWFSTLVPEAFGGGSISGSPVLDAVVIAEEHGRALQPGPFLAANVVASALAERGTDAQRSTVLPALAAGERMATWATADPSGCYEPGVGVVAEDATGGCVLSGVKGLVEDGELADWFLVDARHGDGVTQFLVPAGADGLVVQPLHSLDLTRRLSEVVFDGVQLTDADVVGPPGAAAPDHARQLDLAIALVVADSVGAMDRLLEMTRQYAIDRVAFGRPIGSFQALKHLLADLAMYNEASAAAAVAVARAITEDRPDAAETASIAKAFVGDAGTALAQGCLQVHGGIGFTWEHDLHLFLRRITADRILYGDPDWHRERICAGHGL